MSESILNSKYVEPNRPVSKNELSYLFKKLRSDLRLSDVYARHDCGHMYATRIGSRKEFSIKNGTGSKQDMGNCSVCWKLRNIEPSLKGKAMDVVEYFMYTNECLYQSEEGRDQGCQSPDPTTYSMYDVCNVYYRWLYERTENSDRPRMGEK